MTQRARDLVFSVLMLLGAGLLWWETGKPRYQADKLQDSGFDPAFFPRILLACWVIVALCLLVRSVTAPAMQAEPQNGLRLLGSVVLVALYALGVGTIGFLFATIPFVAVTIGFLGFRQPVVTLLVSVLFPLLTWYAFVHLMNIPLPVSPWFSRM